MDRPESESQTCDVEQTVASRLLLLRFSGDLTTKAKATRRRMISRLVENLRASISASGRAGKVLRERNRLLVSLEPPDPEKPNAPTDEEMAQRLARVFGISSVSITHSIEWSSVEDILREGAAFGAPHVKDRRFAIRARRVGERNNVAISTGDIERQLGEILRPLASRVDLTNPEATVFVEVDPDQAYFFIAKESGGGGLPLGTQGRAVSLLSGGFDSPVASWRLLRRGVEIDYVFCNLGGRQHEIETLTIAKRMADQWQPGTHPRFHSIDFDPVSREIQAKITTRYWQVILKRMMFRVAEAVAASRAAGAIVTGEAIGQVSSQTLQNLSVISEGTKFPIFRPLVGNNKDEIIEESKRIGTHDLSAKVGEYCAIVPSKPATHAKLNVILRQEARMDPSVLAEAIESRTHFLLNDVDLDAWSAEEISTREVTKTDTIIDLRAKPAYTTWHYPDALFLDFLNALQAYATFDPKQRYVLYCEFGIKSAHLADLMRREGLDARHISGGLREVKRIAAKNS